MPLRIFNQVGQIGGPPCRSGLCPGDCRSVAWLLWRAPAKFAHLLGRQPFVEGRAITGLLRLIARPPKDGHSRQSDSAHHTTEAGELILDWVR